jgi:hypothetical protein
MRFTEEVRTAPKATAASDKTKLDRAFSQYPHSFYRRLRDMAPATRVTIWGSRGSLCSVENR